MNYANGNTRQYKFKDVDSAVMFDCFIVTYWFTLRISEVCNLWYMNIRFLSATNDVPEKLQLCAVDSKTNTLKPHDN